MTSRPPDEQNFCRVFELPRNYPNDFCFGGGHSVLMQMVDWFQPWPDSIETWEEVESMLREFVRRKSYAKPDRKYLIITAFDKALIISEVKK